MTTPPSSAGQPVIYVLDDDRDVRDAVAGLLRSVGYSVVAMGSAEELWAKLPVDVPICLVLDVRLPGTNGLELQKQLACRGVPVSIIFITGHADVPTSVRAIKAGAVEFLPKPFSDETLFASVRQGLEEATATWLAQRELRTLRDNYEQLTPREREVFELVASGMPNKEVAFELLIAEATVKIHRGNIMQKMQARSFADLVRMASRIGVVDRDSTGS